MHLLALDTAARRTVVALRRADGVIFGRRGDPAARHGRLLVPLMDEVLREAGLRPAELGAVAVGRGPGSYTGLRIGLTAAKTLGYAPGIPLFALDSLELLAWNAPEAAIEILVMIDAQRGDVHRASFRRPAPGAPPEPAGPSALLPIDTALAELPPGAVVVLGEHLPRERFPADSLAPEDAAWPEPGRLAALAARVVASGSPADPWTLEPLYLRRSAAEDQWTRLGRDPAPEAP